MKIVLPPKRFEDPSDPKFDPIRHKPWFRNLETRRKKLPMLKGALNDHLNVQRTQKEACIAWGVDERELRDYESFVMGRKRPLTATQQHVINNAYEFYCMEFGDEPLPKCIKDACCLWGIQARPVMELYDTDPTFLPKGYFE